MNSMWMAVLLADFSFRVLSAACYFWNVFSVKSIISQKLLPSYFCLFLLTWLFRMSSNICLVSSTKLVFLCVSLRPHLFLLPSPTQLLPPPFPFFLTWRFSSGLELVMAVVVTLEAPIPLKKTRRLLPPEFSRQLLSENLVCWLLNTSVPELFLRVSPIFCPDPQPFPWSSLP